MFLRFLIILFFFIISCQKRNSSENILSTSPASSLTDSQSSATTEITVSEKDFFPNDTYFLDNSQWGILNSGQEIKGYKGIQGIDSNITKAWNLTAGNPDIIIAILDTGIDKEHPDLKQNLWYNSREIPDNSVDDDNNGFIDDINGWNFLDNSPDINDKNGHGTHVAGIIGAVGNNGYGIAGVSWNIKLMPLKVFNPEGESLNEISSTSSFNEMIVQALKYAMNNGSKIINSSSNWSYTSKNDPEILKTLEELEKKNILLVTAAGNDPKSIDKLPLYPASFPNDNILSVAAINQFGELSYSSSYGPVSVDVAAPGENIFSTFPTYLGKEFEFISGTSQATPFVSGQAALIYSRNPSLNFSGVKEAILNSVTKMDSLKGKILTEGRINIFESLVYSSKKL